jgi:hypothetical protein
VPVIAVQIGMLMKTPRKSPTIANTISKKKPAVYEMPFELLSYI